MTLDCNVSVKDWTPVTIDADFNHTTLWVSKTKASVTSTTADSIDYESNVMLTEADFGCDEKVTTSSGEKDVIVLSKLDAVKNHRITFKINEDIKFSDYNGKYKGTAKVWIKAGNIKKYLDVTYDASPYFEVNPQEVTFKIEATSDPVTTTVHYLTVKPKEPAAGFDFEKKIKVTVKPAMGNYRINFRAINDRAHYNGGNGTDNYEGTLEEKKKETYNGTEGNTNWADGWFESAWDENRIYTSQPDNHYVYVYTQIGETTGTQANSPVWKFTGSWPGDKMNPDNTNVGWYYKDFSKDFKSISVDYDAKGEKTIKPGETLIMFSNNHNTNVGYTLHRCPHHLEPGIPLFDYEDREGWIVYDPTSDPTWNIYDAMPTIENINFTIYTRFQTYGWFKVYGVANGKNGDDNNKERESFTIYDAAGKSWSCDNLNNGWYKTVITLKAVKGDHEKDIRIKSDNKNTGGESVLLFNGITYPVYHTGIFHKIDETSKVYNDYQLTENGDNEKKVKGWFYYGVVKVEGKKADETTTTYYMLDRNLGASNNGYYAPDVVALAKNKKAIGGYFCISEKKSTSDATQDLSSTLAPTGYTFPTDAVFEELVNAGNLEVVPQSTSLGETYNCVRIKTVDSELPYIYLPMGGFLEGESHKNPIHVNLWTKTLLSGTQGFGTNSPEYGFWYRYFDVYNKRKGLSNMRFVSGSNGMNNGRYKAMPIRLVLK